MIWKKTVLLSKSSTLEALFRSHDYETSLVSDSLAALSLLTVGDIDLLVIDSDIPNGRMFLGIVMGFGKVPAKITIRDDMHDTYTSIGSAVIRVDSSTSDETWLEIVEHDLVPHHTEETPLKDKILIVDDVVELLEMYRTMFELRGYQIETAKDGLEGITKAVSFQPKYILLDIMMPHMDGFELMKTFHNNTSLESIIIVNSNIDGAGFVERIYTAWADYYLRKSDYVPSQIVYMIEQGLFTKKRDKAIPVENKPFNPGKDFFPEKTL